MEEKELGLLSGLPPSDRPQGPRRKAPQYYVGESYGRYRVNHYDADIYPNGARPGIRDKLARRRIRAALKRVHSSVERGLTRTRALKAQAMDAARDEKKSTRWGRRLYDAELAIHVPVYAPSQKELRAMRTAKRKLKRQGKKDAISQLVDKMAERK